VESFLEYGPYFIIIGIFALFGLGFKEPLTNLYHRYQRTKSTTNETSVSERVVEVVQKIGQPVRIDDKKIQYYESRDQVDFIQLLNLAKKEIRMSGLTFSLLTLNHSRLISQLTSQKIRLTFLILNPDSTHVEKQTSLYKASEDLKYQIQKSLERLCELRQYAPDFIDIKIYDELVGDSIIIIDKTVAKVEERIVNSDANSRRSKIAFKKDNKQFFKEAWDIFKKLENSSDAYIC
jgi:hypothetical protein